MSEPFPTPERPKPEEADRKEQELREYIRLAVNEAELIVAPEVRRTGKPMPLNSTLGALWVDINNETGRLYVRGQGDNARLLAVAEAISEGIGDVDVAKSEIA